MAIAAIVIAANTTNGKVSKALSATTVANVSSNGYPFSLDRRYALTGSPPPRPDGVRLLIARPTSSIGSVFLTLVLISARSLRTFQRNVYRKKIAN